MTSSFNRESGSMVVSSLGFVVVLVVVLCVEGYEDQRSTEASPTLKSSKCRISTNGDRELIATTVGVDQCLCVTDKDSCDPRTKCAANQTLGVYPSATTITVCLAGTASTTESSTAPTSSTPAPIPAQRSLTNIAATENPVAASTSDATTLQRRKNTVANLSPDGTTQYQTSKDEIGDMVTLEGTTKSGDDVTEGSTVLVVESTLGSTGHPTSVTEAPGEEATTSSLLDDTTLQSTTTSRNSEGGRSKERHRTKRGTGGGKAQRNKREATITSGARTTTPDDVSANPSSVHGDPTTTPVSLTSVTPTSAPAKTTNQGAKSGTFTVKDVTDPGRMPTSMTTDMSLLPRTDVTATAGSDVTTKSCWSLSVPDPPEEPALQQSGNNSILVRWNWPRNQTNLWMILTWNGSNEDYTNDSSYKIHLQQPWRKCNLTLGLCIQREDDPCASFICGVKRVISIYAVPEAPGQLESLNQSSATNSTVVLTWNLPELLYPELQYRVELYWINGNGSTNETIYEVGPFLPGSENNVEARLCVSDDEWEAICGPAVNITVHTLPGAPSAVEDLKALTVGSEYIETEWSAPSEANGPLDFYLVVWEENASVKIDVQGKPRVNCNITELQPWTNYSIHVTACNNLPAENEDVCGELSTLNVQTDAAAPSSVSALNVTSTGSTFVDVEWDEPMVKNGPVSFYLIKWARFTYDDSEEVKVDGGYSSTTYNISRLKPWLMYTISVKACNEDFDKNVLCGEEEFLDVKTAVDAPSSVTALNVTSTGSTFIDIMWEEPTDENGPITFYLIKWARLTSDVSKEVKVTGGKRYTTYNISRLEPWSNYTISVKACNEDLDKNVFCGDEESLTVATAVGAPSSVPALTVTSTGSTFMDVMWDEPTVKHGPVSFYLIKWARSTSDDSRAVEVAGGDSPTTYNISRLKPWSNYTISVKACNEDLDENVLCGEDASVTVATAAGAPSAPRNLRLTNILDTSMTIAWERPGQANGPLDGYEVSSSIDGSSLSFSNSTDTSATLTHLKPYTTYKVVVRAFNVQDGKRLLGTSSSLNGTTQIGTPGLPTSILGEATASSLTLSWRAPREPNGPLDGYNVTWAAKGKEENHTVTSIAEIIIDNLKAYTVYQVNVRAFNRLPSGEVLAGEEATWEHTTCPDAPSAPTSVSASPGTRTISLEWRVPEVLNGALNGYTVRLVDADGTHVQREVDVQGTRTVLTGLKPYSRYNVSVAAYNLYNSTTKLIGDEYRTQVLTFPEPPGPMKDVQVTAYRNNSVRLSWKLPSETRGKLTSFLLDVNDTKGDGVTEQYNYSLLKLCKEGHCEHLFTRLHAECEYLFGVRAINEGVRQPGALNALTVTIPPGDPPQAKNISSSVEGGIAYQPYSQFLFSMAPDTFNDFNGAIVAYEVIASESSCIGQSVAGNLTWGDVTSKDAVPPYLASPKGWNPFQPGPSRSYDPMACSVSNSRAVCILGAQHCPSNAPMPCNGPLKSGKSYAMYVRGYTAGGSRATAPLHFSTEPLPEKSDAGAIAGGVIGGLIIGLIILAAGVYSKRFRITIGRQKSQSNGNIKAAQITDSSVELVHVSSSNGLPKKGEQAVAENVAMSPEESTIPIVHIPKGPIKKSEFSAYVDDMMKDCGYKFMDEYERLVELSPHYRCDAAREPENSKKNRFTNIHPFDKNRVPLSEINGDPHSSYINASFIQGFNGTREYVAAQGPNVTTINDFWRMVWEHDVRCIVMLTQCVEGNKKKCERYWPDEEQSYGDVNVKKASVTTHEDYTVTLFSIKSDDSSHWRDLNHVFFTGWPDHGVPETPDKLIEFVRACQKFFGPRTGNQPPIVVHCSAGVGRTGTFIALDYLLQLLQVQETVHIFSLVLQLREGRRCMVQNESQYIYLHKCVKAVLQEDENDTPSSSSPDEPIYENVDSLRDVRA
ncbi:phosphatidylinositol phosphatase PTPRQ-like [Ornithodoros turicata]|uniref:phosphatidylinositol phosphatase PTPRQ-like n=1 Tax=Ornithodoros turicata TaxID=34597 RepID=UPI00313903A8